MAKQSGGPGKDRRKKKASCRRFKVRYPAHALKPEDLLDFIELPAFTKRWEKLGLDDDDDLSALQVVIMLAPKAASPIKNTDGIRKLRFAPDKWNIGKSGAARVLYVYFERLGFVLLCLVYGKSEVDNISDSVKKQLNKFVRETEKELERRYFNK